MSQALLSNPGIVGIAVAADWSDVEPSQGTYDFSTMDARIAEIEGAGKKVLVGVTASAAKAPAWMFVDPNVQTIEIQDPNPAHGNGLIPVVLFWDPVFHAGKEALLRAVGGRYSADPHVIGAMVGFANYYTNDWGIPIDFHDHGYSYDAMVQIGKDILQTAADAFPNQAIKLPIGQNDRAMDADKTTTQMAQDIVSWARLAPFGDRFFAQKNLINTASPYADDPRLASPDPSSNDFLLALLRDMTPHMGLQMVASAVGGPQDGCRQNGHQTPCDDVSAVLAKSIDVSLSYKPTYLEFWTADATDPSLYPQLSSATAKMMAQ